MNSNSSLLVPNLSKLDIEALEGLEINGHSFKEGTDYLGNQDVLFIEIPETFRFKTELSFIKDTNGDKTYLTVQQFLIKGPSVWDMGAGIDRLEFRDHNIAKEIKKLCDTLVNCGICKWSD